MVGLGGAGREGGGGVYRVTCIVYRVSCIVLQRVRAPTVLYCLPVFPHDMVKYRLVVFTLRYPVHVLEGCHQVVGTCTHTQHRTGGEGGGGGDA